MKTITIVFGSRFYKDTGAFQLLGCMLLCLLFLGAMPIMLSGISPNLLFIGGGYAVLLGIVCALDYLTNPLFTKCYINPELTIANREEVLAARRKSPKYKVLSRKVI